MKILLLIIDAQNDFVMVDGRLSVPGGEKALKELIKFIKKNKEDLDDILLTVDDHYPTHIGLAGAWRKGNEDLVLENGPIVITSQDLLDGKYMPKFLDWEKTVKYLKKIESLGEEHHIWPDHCIHGSVGQAFPEELVQALKEWSLVNEANHYGTISKGTRDDAEMYSAFSYADGSEPEFQQEIIDLIADQEYDQIYVAGFAKDFCVRCTLQDLMKDDRFEGKLVLLDDCMASIDPDSEVTQEVWENLVEDFGAKVWKTSEDQ